MEDVIKTVKTILEATPAHAMLDILRLAFMDAKVKFGLCAVEGRVCISSSVPVTGDVNKTATTILKALQTSLDIIIMYTLKFTATAYIFNVAAEFTAFFLLHTTWSNVSHSPEGLALAPACILLWDLELKCNSNHYNISSDRLLAKKGVLTT